MLRRGDKVLVGVSGGPDSVTLLNALNSLRKEYALEIVVAHLDHKFRGEESRSDRRFCEDLAKAYGLEIVSGEIDVPKIASEKGISSEEAARFERYDFFKRTAGKKGIQKIAVGHNADDQAETVLMRLMRGAGMAGLGGMNPVKDMGEFQVIRPLMEVTRKEIEEFVKENKLCFRRDSSNEKDIFTRNRVRRSLIPFLEKEFNPNIKEVLANTAENLRAENEFLEKFSRRKFNGMSRVRASGISINLKKLKEQPDAIRKRVMRAALQELKGDLRRLTYQHWKEMGDLIEARPVNSKVDLPAGISIVKHRNELVCSKS